MSWIHMLISVGATALSTIPLAAKWELGVRRVGIAMATAAGFWTLVITGLGRRLPGGTVVRMAAIWAMSMITGAGILAYRFYRDPERDVPQRHDVVLSPADGTVLYVRESRNGTVPVSSKHGHDYTLEELTKTSLQTQDAVIVGIAMNFLDVHVNRAPIAGRITLQKHFSGSFLSLKKPEALTENERATTVIERDGLQVGIVQIASRLVRQIVSYVQEGDQVELGQRIGAIRFGSQVDLILPRHSGLHVQVQPGEYVVAGETILAERSSGPDADGHEPDLSGQELATARRTVRA